MNENLWLGHKTTPHTINQWINQSLNDSINQSNNQSCFTLFDTYDYTWKKNW